MLFHYLCKQEYSATDVGMVKAFAKFLVLDSVLSLELVKILLHHIGARRTLCPFRV
jgi:hypothetical protein